MPSLSREQLGAICRRLASAGFKVIAIDKIAPPETPGMLWIDSDLADLGQDPGAGDVLLASIESALNALGAERICGLVNNAASQVIGPAQTLGLDEFKHSLDVNVMAPFVLARSLYRHLVASLGCIVNIGSIHARLTKPGFCAYSTSKAALAGLTRALSVEWGAVIRVALIEPAAIATPMLAAGFQDNPDAMSALSAAHPANVIGDADHIAHWVHHLLTDTNQFVNGAVINIDGGISSRLHDP
jgi:NAD(P)-dependent dehydrogenase (short-subunit alcohol dehydrogenase family)